MFKLHAAWFISVAAFCSACATLPEFREPPLNTADVVLNIKCELRDAVWNYPENAWANDWNAGLTLSLIVDHKGGVDADTGFTFPMSNGSTFVASLAGGVLGSSLRKISIDFDENLTKMRDQDLRCPDGDAGRFARLEENLGIAGALERAGKANQFAKIDTKTLKYDIDFIVRKSLTPTPRFNLVPLGPNKIFSGSLKLNGERTDTHKLAIILKPPEKTSKCPVDTIAGDCPSLVYLVNPPTAGVAGGSDAGGGAGILPNNDQIKRARGRKQTTTTRQRPVFRQPQPAISRSESQGLDAARARNVLENIELDLDRLDVPQ